MSGRSTSMPTTRFVLSEPTSCRPSSVNTPRCVSSLAHLSWPRRCRARRSSPRAPRSSPSRYRRAPFRSGSANDHGSSRRSRRQRRGGRRRADGGERAVVGLPSAPVTATGTLSLSVEVPEPVAPSVVASDDVRVVLVEPGTDDAMPRTPAREPRRDRRRQHHHDDAGTRRRVAGLRRPARDRSRRTRRLAASWLDIPVAPSLSAVVTGRRQGSGP